MSESIRFVRSDFSDSGTIYEAAPDPLLRRLLVWPGVKDKLDPYTISLFTRNQGAWRFETDDGRVTVVPLSMEVVERLADRGEVVARECAIQQLEGTSYE